MDVKRLGPDNNLRLLVTVACRARADASRARLGAGPTSGRSCFGHYSVRRAPWSSPAGHRAMIRDAVVLSEAEVRDGLTGRSSTLVSANRERADAIWTG